MGHDTPFSTSANDPDTKTYCQTDTKPQLMKQVSKSQTQKTAQ